MTGIPDTSICVGAGERKTGSAVPQKLSLLLRSISTKFLLTTNASRYVCCSRTFFFFFFFFCFVHNIDIHYRQSTSLQYIHTYIRTKLN